MKNAKGFRFPNSPPPKPMAFWRRPPLLATSRAPTPGLQDRVRAAGPGKASHSRRSLGGGLRLATSAAAPAAPLAAPPAARRARVPDESPAPDATLTARLRRHYSLPMAAAGAARRGAAASALSSLGSRCSGLGARYRRGPASRAQAPPRITWPRPLTRPRPLAACAADVRRVAMATADAHVRELPPCWGVRSLS